MKHGVQFIVNNKSYYSSDFGLTLSPFTIPIAEPKTTYIDVEGASGSLDASEVFGLQYKDVEFDLDFTFTNYNELLSKKLKSVLHGKRGRITIYSDPEYYYDARMTVSETKGNGKVKTITVSCVAKPFRLKQDVTTIYVKSDSDLTIENTSMNTVPTFKSEHPFTVDFDGETYSLDAGENIIPDVVFVEGENKIIVKTDSEVKIEFQEGVL